MTVWALNYQAHEGFVDPARERSQVWRLLLGLTLAAALFLALSQMIFGTLLSLMGPGSVESVVMDGRFGQTAFGMFVLLGQLGLLSVAVGLVCIMVHKRSPATLIGPARIALTQFASVSLAMLTLFVALIVLPPYGYGEPLTLNMNVDQWLFLLPFSLVAVMIQASAEEVLFRGYLQQQLAARFQSPLIWVLVPSLLFGLGHYHSGSAGSNATTITIWAVVFGILMADLTARAGTLGPAIAVHFFNNVSAMVLVSTPDQMSGLALFVLPFGMTDEARMAAWLPVDFGLMLVAWLVARLAIRA